MLNIYMSINDKIEEIDEIKDGTWVCLTNPSLAEIDSVSKTMNIEVDFLSAALDEEERSRIEVDDETNNVLIIVDVPILDFETQSRIFTTIPLALIVTKAGIVSVCLKKTAVIQSFLEKNIKTFYTFKKSRFILQVLYTNASFFLQYLKEIDKQSKIIIIELQKSMKNKEFLGLLNIEKSLVYFGASLKSNQLVLQKLLRYEFIKKYEEDTELLEDTIIENKQAIEMATIYLEIINSTTATFSAVISNNANMVMKFLTSITIIMTIPTIISGIYGMNVANIPLGFNPFGFYIICAFTALCCAVAGFLMYKSKMF